MGSDASATAQSRARRIASMAYQNGFLDDPGLREALDRLDRTPGLDLGAWLDARGVLPPGARALLEGLADLLDCRAPAGPSTVLDVETRAPQAGIRPEVASLAPRSSGYRREVPRPGMPPDSTDELTPISSVGTVMSPSLFAGGPTGDAHPGAGADGLLNPAVRYQPVRFHAQGGLGMVYLALDQELNREVALKEIKDRHADDPSSRARFVKEAEITGQLEHPGIVPIYGLGAYLDGRPFYAMRFIRGESLHEAIKRFHRDALLTPSGKARDSRRAVGLVGLLRRFLDICNAVEYAHSRGVLHRDLKPGNVMVGPFGETLVVDWGLARVMGSEEEPAGGGANPSASGSADGAIRVSPSGASAETTQGDMVGTVGYMSPEQAEGRLGELGPASDVYSLGSILYTILTGRPTLLATGRDQVIRAIAAGDFPAPRQLAPEVPRALEAICLKALSVPIARRYPTPRALAADLERWLADEPVEALPDRRVDRVARWARRHKQASVYAGMALLAVAAVAVIAAVLVDGARRKANDARVAESRALARASDALRLANAARADADRNFRQARKAVDDFLTAVSDSKELQLLPDTQAVRKRLLTKARDYYQQFIQSRGDDPTVRAETGAANWRLAHIVGEVGSMDEALRLNEEAVRILDEAAAGQSAPRARELLGEALNGLATIQQRMNKIKDAEVSYRRSAGVLARLRGEHPDEPEIAIKAASVLGNLGNLLALTGREDEADAEYRRSGAILDGLGGEKAGRTDVPAMLGRTLAHAADLNHRRGRLAQAEALYRRSAALYEALLREHPQAQEFRLGLADALTNLGVLERRTDRLPDAERSYARAADAYERLARENPRVPTYRYDLAGVRTNQGNVLRATRRFDASEAAFRKAIDDLEGLVRDNPDVAAYRQTLAGTLGNLGNTLMDLKRYDEAEAVHRRAIDLYERLLAEGPTMVDFRHGFAGALQNLAGVIATRKPTDEALALTRRAVRLQREALAASPKNPRFLRFLDSHLEVLGRILRARGDGLGAAEATRERSKLWPGDPDMQYDLACEFALASALTSGLDSEKLRNEAISTLRAAVSAGFDDADHLAHDPDLTPLRPLPAYQSLLQSLQDRTLPADPFTP